ncbi:MAG: ABC transporter ATP-binding protein [Actinomycetaceae bacterium]|nr:ABC transporter ATP-binding protein [Actinomycetaceae bacterium]
MPLIEMSGVTRTVTLPDGDDLHILRGIDLQVEAGEFVSVVGRSGTGKSTLLNIIGMLDDPTSGTYLVDGHDIAGLSESRRSRMRGEAIGFVFQQFNIFAARTAMENVEVPLLYAEGMAFWRRHDRARRMLERVGLGSRLDSYPSQMSGGEQQRIAIARALVRTPRIILADEPTGALDPETGNSIIELLKEVATENDSALIIITHDMDIAAQAHTRYSLYDGVLHSAKTREAA